MFRKLTALTLNSLEMEMFENKNNLFYSTHCLPVQRQTPNSVSQFLFSKIEFFDSG